MKSAKLIKYQSKQVFNGIQKYLLSKSDRKIEGSDLHNLLDANIDLNKIRILQGAASPNKEDLASVIANLILYCVKNDILYFDDIIENKNLRE